MLPSIYLLIPDTALREAVIEQIKATGIGEARVVDTSSETAKASLLIVTDTHYDKKTAAVLQGLAEKPTILMIGECENVDAIAETFPKPLRLGHLLTRIRYHLETAPLLRDRTIGFGFYRLEPHNRRVLHIKNSEVTRLTEKETALLVYLADSKRPATRRDILAGVWGYDERIDTHTLETHLYQLRRKLDDAGEGWLVSEAGTYRLAQGAE